MFEVKTQYKFQDFLILNKLATKTYRRWRSLIIRMFLVAVGVSFITAGVLFLLLEGFVFGGVLCLFVGLLLLLRSIFVNYLNAMQSNRQQIKGVTDIRFVFEEDSFFNECAIEKAIHSYEALHSIFRYRERYFLFVDKNHAYILPFSSFVSGEPEKFEGFLSEKCGREWNRLNTGKSKERKIKV